MRQQSALLGDAGQYRLQAALTGKELGAANKVFPHVKQRKQCLFFVNKQLGFETIQTLANH